MLQHWQSLVVVLLGALFVVCDATLTVFDLTHVQSPDTIYWPGNPAYKFDILFRDRNPDHGFWYESNAFFTAEHGGTHLDSPAHFAEGKLRVHEIPMANLVGPGVIIDVKDKVAADPDYRVTHQDVQDWEDKYGTVPDGAIVIMNSGWTENYPNKSLTFGTSTPSEPSTFHFPAWHQDTVDWLVKNRNIHVLGVDTPSNDYGQSTTFPVHVILGKANKPGLENVANLDSIPEAGTTVFAAAIKLYDGSGGPARVFATYDRQGGGATGSASVVTWSTCLTLLVVIMSSVVRFV